MNAIKGIQELRHKRGWTQRELASKSGVTQASISEIEQGRRTRPHSSTLKKLADAFGVSVPELYEPSPPAPVVEEEPRALDESRGRLELLEATTANILEMARELDPANNLDRVAMGFLQSKIREIATVLEKKADNPDHPNPFADHLQGILADAGEEAKMKLGVAETPADQPAENKQS